MRKKLVFDENNARVITEDDDPVIYMNDVDDGDDYVCPNEVMAKVIEMWNNGIPLVDDHETDIDAYLLNEERCTQDSREIIVETLFNFD